MAFDKAKKEEVKEIGRPWNVSIDSEVQPIYQVKCIIIVGMKVAATKEQYVDDLGSFLPQGALGTIKEAIIREDGTVYGVYFEDVHWVFDTPCGIQGEVSSGTFHWSEAEMKNMGLSIGGN